MTLQNTIQDLFMQDLSNQQIIDTLFSKHSNLVISLTIEEIEMQIQKALKDLEDEQYADYYLGLMDSQYDNYDY